MSQAAQRSGWHWVWWCEGSDFLWERETYIRCNAVGVQEKKMAWFAPVPVILTKEKFNIEN